MAKALTRSQLKKKLDTEFSIYIRRRDSDDWTGYGSCITCGKVKHWKTVDPGHYISRRCLPIRWDEHNVHFQCKGCNGFNNGEPQLYRERLLSMYGEDEVNRLESTYKAWKASETDKWTMDELRDLLEYYQKKNR